jgi:hypothetical protein
LQAAGCCVLDVIDGLFINETPTFATCAYRLRIMPTRSNVRLLLSLAATYLIASAVSAAEFRVAGANKAGCDILGVEKICLAVEMSGKIEPGDSAKFSAFLARVDASPVSDMPMRVGQLFLDSPGGNVAEAMKLGRIIRNRQIGTFVPGDSACASACVLLLAAGVHRGALGPVEIHSFYSKEFVGTGNFEEASKQFDLLAKSVDVYLREMRVPRAGLVG